MARPAPLCGRDALLAVVVTCMVATLSYAGAVTTSALLSLLIPSTLLCATVASGWAWRGHPYRGVVSALPVALLAAEVVNVVSGDNQGPVARSAFAAGLATVLAVAAAGGRAPALFIVPVCGIVLGALALGSGHKVGLVAAATALCATCALALLEQSRRRWLGARRRAAMPVISTLIVGASAVAALAVQNAHNQRPPEVIFKASVDRNARSFLPDPFTPLARVRPSAAPSPPATALPLPPRQRTKPSIHHSWVRRAAIITALLVGIAVLMLAIRLMWVRWVWRRLRQRLRAGTPASGICGAWLWAAHKLRSSGHPLPAHMSPDVFMGAPSLDRAAVDAATDPLRALARTATRASFSAAPSFIPAEVDTAWELANSAARATTAGSPLHVRALLPFRLPAGRSRQPLWRTTRALPSNWIRVDGR